MPYRAEYIWIDGRKPTQLLRSKTKVVPDGTEPPIWGFDGSSTEQAPGGSLDSVQVVALNLVQVCFHQQGGKAEYAIHGCTDFVTHVRQKF